MVRCESYEAGHSDFDLAAKVSGWRVCCYDYPKAQLSP